MLQKITTAKRLIETVGVGTTLRFTFTKGWLQHSILNSDLLIRRPPSFRKFHLMNELAHFHGYSSILEISTPTSGGTYNQLDQSRFRVRRRLSYLAPDDWTDEAPVDYRSNDLDTSACIDQIHAQGMRFDVVFIDACHEYQSTRRDLQNALNLVNSGGIIVLHDCLPDDEAKATPLRLKRSWYGVTYKAFLDALIAHNDLWYCTVDADYGCGMIRRSPKTHLYKRACDIKEFNIRAWDSAGNNFTKAYQVYDSSKYDLMNIVTVDEFLNAEWENRKRRLKFPRRPLHRRQ